MKGVRRAVQALLRPTGYQLARVADGETLPADYDDLIRRMVEVSRPFTLTSHERVAALVQSVRYVTGAGVPGAFVECGVWRGGSALVMIETLLALGVTDRDVWLYDTFWIDMPPPSEADVDVFGNTAEELLAAAHSHGGYRNGTAESVRQLLTGTGYPADRIHIVEGLVEETIPGTVPEEIALCRLDTDFYESTAHEMRHLLPRIPEGGVLLVDDYGHFLGSQRAVDEYLESLGASVLLQRIDFTGRLLVVSRDLHQRARRLPSP